MSNEYGGFDSCIECGHSEIVHTKQDLEELEGRTDFNSNGDAIFSSCGAKNDLCDLFDG